jgi:SAM-dependent methyltransferase
VVVHRVVHKSWGVPGATVAIGRATAETFPRGDADVNQVQRWLLRSSQRRASPVLDGYLAVLLDGVRGRVVEVGCGIGQLFARYPRAVDTLLAVEPDAEMRAAARSRTHDLRFPATVVDATPGGGIPAARHSADVVVCCEVLCSVADPRHLLAEIRRVLRPGGELRVFEHVAAGVAVGRAAQTLLDALGWPRLLGGCHCGRATGDAVRRAGFDTSGIRRVWYARTPMLVPLGPHLLGTARAQVPGNATYRQSVTEGDHLAG